MPTHLDTIISHWPDLQTALTTTGRATWPPAGRMVTHLRQLHDEDELDDHRAARDGTGAGEHPAPLNITVLDTMRTVEAALVDLADQTAALIQRPAISRAPRDWPADDRARRDELAAADAADPRRWRYVGQRTAPYAAAWLAARLAGITGPFSKLPDPEADRIRRIAETAAQRVLAALEMDRRSTVLDVPCACGGTLVVEGGDGTDPALRCRSCARTWTGHAAA